MSACGFCSKDAEFVDLEGDAICSECSDPITRCVDCGTPLEVNVLMMYKQEVFCPSQDCPLFVQSFWVERVHA